MELADLGLSPRPSPSHLPGADGTVFTCARTELGSRAFPISPPLHPSPSILLPSVPHPTSWLYLELVTPGSTFKYLRPTLADAGPRNFRGSSGRVWPPLCPSSPPVLPEPWPLSSSLWEPGRTTCPPPRSLGVLIMSWTLQSDGSSATDCDVPLPPHPQSCHFCPL